YARHPRPDARSVPASDRAAARVHHPVSAAHHRLVIEAERKADGGTESAIICIDDLAAMTAYGVRRVITTEPQDSRDPSGRRVWSVDVQIGEVIVPFRVGQHDVVTQPQIHRKSRGHLIVV